MHFANCAALATVLITITENLRLCSSAEAELFLNFEKNEPRVLIKHCSYKKKCNT